MKSLILVVILCTIASCKGASSRIFYPPVFAVTPSPEEDARAVRELLAKWREDEERRQDEFARKLAEALADVEALKQELAVAAASGMITIDQGVQELQRRLGEKLDAILFTDPYRRNQGDVVPISKEAARKTKKWRDSGIKKTTLSSPENNLEVRHKTTLSV